jgi:hypothetical protein
MKPKTQRRRTTKPVPVPEPLLSPWKRIAAAAAFGVGGGGCAYWGIHDISVFVNALASGAPIIETQSAMPGLPLIGFGLFAIGASLLLPAASTTRFRLVQERAAVAILLSLLVGAVLSLAGSLIINAMMDGFDYRSCEVRHGRRMTFVTWAARDAECPKVDADR